jgi:hypothetical protein
VDQIGTAPNDGSVPTQQLFQLLLVKHRQNYDSVQNAICFDAMENLIKHSLSLVKQQYTLETKDHASQTSIKKHLENQVKSVIHEQNRTHVCEI